jgi:hypothetical protein
LKWAMMHCGYLEAISPTDLRAVKLWFNWGGVCWTVAPDHTRWPPSHHLFGVVATHTGCRLPGANREGRWAVDLTCRRSGAAVSRIRVLVLSSANGRQQRRTPALVFLLRLCLALFTAAGTTRGSRRTWYIQTGSDKRGGADSRASYRNANPHGPSLSRASRVWCRSPIGA